MSDLIKNTLSGFEEMGKAVASKLTFTGLSGTPGSYDDGKFLVSLPDGIGYTGLSGQISSEEIDWNVYPTPSDLPDANAHHGMFAHVHSEGAGYMAHDGQWEKIYPQSFTGLSDTPSSLTADKYLKVNSAGDGFEFADAGGGGGGDSSGCCNTIKIRKNDADTPTLEMAREVISSLYFSYTWAGGGTPYIYGYANIDDITDGNSNTYYDPAGGHCNPSQEGKNVQAYLNFNTDIYINSIEWEGDPWWGRLAKIKSSQDTKFTLGNNATWGVTPFTTYDLGETTTSASTGISVYIKPYGWSNPNAVPTLDFTNLGGDGKVNQIQWTKGYCASNGGYCVPAGNSCPKIRNIKLAYSLTDPSILNYIVQRPFAGGASAATNPTIYLQRGQSYTFEVESAGNPFYIKTANVGGTSDLFSAGVTNNGVGDGNLTFQVPYDAPETLYYVSSNVPTLSGMIKILAADGGSHGGGGSTTGVTGVESLGAGSALASGVSGNDLYLKSLVGGTNVTLSSDDNTITINASAGGGGGGGSSSSLNNNDYVKDYSNFSGELPDAILVRPNTAAVDQVVMGRFYYIDGPISSDKIYYTFNEHNGDQYLAKFNNDASGSNASFQCPGCNWTFFDGATSLQEIIDNKDSIYYGDGSSCSSGVTDWSGISDISNFYTGVPENIFVEHSNGYYAAQFQNINSLGIVYSLNPTENKYLTFHNNAQGTFSAGNYTNAGSTQTWTANSGPSLSGLISAGYFHHGGNCNAGRAGGAGGAGGAVGGGESSSFTGLSDTPDSYNSGKFLQSSATGLDWVNAPAGGGLTGWTETNNHILPNVTEAYDIGSAERKVRHLFLSDNSLKFVDSSDNITSINTSSFTITGLSDTFDSYNDSSGKYLRVNKNEDGVEFAPLDLSDSDLDFTVDSTEIQFIEKKLSTNIKSDQTISDFTFPNLIVGRTYRVSATLSFYSETETNLVQAEIWNGANKLITLSNKGRSTTASASMLFIATADSVTVEGKNLSNIDYIIGDPTISVVQLELPPSAIVSVDQQPINPGNPPASGLFTIGDINLHGSIIDFQDNNNTGLNSIPFSTSFGDIKIISNIQNTGDQNSFEDIDPTLPSFGVMSIGDIKVNTFIQNTGDQVSQIATPPFEPQHNALYSWSGTT